MMKFNRLCSGLYYSEDNLFEIERTSEGWTLRTKSNTYTCRFDTVEGTFRTLSEAKEEAVRIDDDNRSPYGLRACVQSIAFQQDVLKQSASEIYADLKRSEEVNGVFFNSKMWDAFNVLFPDFTAEETTETTEEPKEAETVKTAQNLEALETLISTDRETYRETVKTLRADLETLEATYSETSGEAPSTTVSALVEKIGYNRAVALVATLINCSAWDGRISQTVAEWAEVTPSAWTEEAARRMCIYTAIHKAHLDQIAQVMMQYQPEPETVHAFTLFDGTQGFPIYVAETEAEALRLWDKVMEQDGGRDVLILDANGEDVTDRLLMAEEPQEASEPVPMVSVDSLRADLDTGNYGEFLNDYRDSTSGVSDAIAEIADSHTSIYYSDILNFISENPESLAEVIEQGLYDPTHNYNLYEHGQAAEYMLIERDLYEHIEDSLMLVALEFIQRDLGTDEIPEDLAEKLPEWAEEAAFDSMDYMPDRIREYLDEFNGEV